MYDHLARYYDELVGDETAEHMWADWIETWSPSGTLLDCACGSGDITALLAKSHEVTGMDLSARMVNTAFLKYPGLCFRQGDMTDLEGFGKYQTITCLCDSINYLSDQESLCSFLEEAWAHLEKDGLLLFDMHTEDRVEEFENGWMETGTFADGTQVQWDIESDGNRLYQTFTFWKPDGGTEHEYHIQRIWSPEEMAEALEESGFEILDVKTDFDIPGIAPGEKHFYCARRME